MSSRPVHHSPPPKDLVQNFRGEMRASVPLHPLERALVVVAALHLCFLPWAIGTRTPWAQLVSLGIGLVGIGLALWPRRYVGELAPDKDFTLHTWPRLLRFPVFWLGLAFLAYVLVGALNPAWERVSTGIVWFLRGVEHVEWLPSSVTAPFARMNAWRMLVIYGAGWLLICALWIGLTRRTAVQRILTILVINGGILALIGILQKVTDATKILWFVPSIASYFHSTFVYKNHAGAYFVLLFVLTLGLAIWHHVRSLRRLERSSPAPVFSFVAVVIGACVFMSGSRTAMLLLAGYLIIALTVYLIWRGNHNTGPTNRFVSILLAAGALGFIATAAAFLDLDNSIDQIKRLADQDRHQSIEHRLQVRDATIDLFRDQPVSGWGAGSFRHTFPIHQQSYPDIYRGFGRVLIWDHAHNDYVQALAELGVVGVLFPLLGIGWVFVRLCRLGALTHPAYLLLILGFGLTLAHAWVDFPLSNPAIQGTFIAAWILTLRWIELEAR